MRPTESLKKLSWHLKHSFCSTRTFGFDLAVGHGTEVALMTPLTSMCRPPYRVANGNQVDLQRMFNNHLPSHTVTALNNRIHCSAQYLIPLTPYAIAVRIHEKAGVVHITSPSHFLDLSRWRTEWIPSPSTVTIRLWHQASSLIVRLGSTLAEGCKLSV